MPATARAGSFDSAAATVVISAPVSAKITVVTPASTETAPAGAKPPNAVRFDKAGARLSGQSEDIGAGDRDEGDDGGDLDGGKPELELAIEARRGEVDGGQARQQRQPDRPDGKGGHCCRMMAPASASTATTIIQKYQ